MADLKSIEMNYLEEFLEMESGYVLDFSNNSLERFVYDSIDIGIYEDKGYENYCSKANKIRQILRQESNEKVAQLLQDLLDYKEFIEIKRAEFLGEEISTSKRAIKEKCEQIIKRLKGMEISQASLQVNSKITSETIIQNSSNLMSVKEYDVFISHAWEDKKGFVEPLARALQQEGINTWYDSDQIGWGESIRQSIDKGLINSRFCMVVLSPYFLSKYWTGTYELNGIFQRESQVQGSLILPIWHNIGPDEIRKFNLTLTDLKALDTSLYSINQIVGAMKNKLQQN